MQIVQILSIILSIFIVLIVIESIRRGMLKEKYALFWLFTSLTILTLSVWRELLHILAHAFGFYYPPSFLFLVGLGFLHLIALHFSILFSRISEKNKKLAQELGLMKEELKKIKGQMDTDSDKFNPEDKSTEKNTSPDH
jgi:hypothetical protein